MGGEFWKSKGRQSSVVHFLCLEHQPFDNGQLYKILDLLLGWLSSNATPSWSAH